MSAFTITKKLCGALELNKQPERRMKLVTTAVLLPVAGFMNYVLCLIKEFLFRNQQVIEGSVNPVLGFWEGLLSKASCQDFISNKRILF